MGLKYVFTFFRIGVKFFLIYLITVYAYQALADEDIYYENRKNNRYCQNPCETNDCKTQEVICTKNKFKKFVYLYLDSVPFDLFNFENDYSKGNSKTYIVKHSGISDSGPVFSSVATGKISNKYEGQIAHLDNLFYQFKNAGFKIKAFGYNYPIHEMIGTNYFEHYRNNGEGFHGAFCSEFFNLKDVIIEEMTVPESLMTDHAQINQFFKREYSHYKEVISKRKQEIFACLKTNFEDNLSIFLYDVYSDTIGHEFSRQSKIYLKKIAALKANLDIFFEFMQTNEPETALFIFSDHGVVSSLWETEISNHGSATKLNESFLFIFNTKFLKTEFDEKSTLQSIHVPSVFAQVLDKVNFPMNYLGMPSPLSRTIYHQMMTFRMKETQIYEYLSTFDQEFLSKNNINVTFIKSQSPFFKFTYLIEQKHNFDGEQSKNHIGEYQKFVMDLNSKLIIFNETKNETDDFNLFLLKILLVVFFLIENIVVLASKMKENFLLFCVSYFVFMSMPLFFLFKAQVIETGFVFLQFLILGLVLAYAVCNSNRFDFSLEFQYKISALIMFSLILLGFNHFVNQNNAFFMFYQNKFLQTFVIIVFLFWSYFFCFKHDSKTSNSPRSTRFVVFFRVIYYACDLFAVTYEIILILSSNYFQDKFMQGISQAFYVTIIFLFCFAFAFVRGRNEIFISILSKCVFWFGHNYLRLTYFLLVFPLIFLFKKIDIQFKMLSRENFAANYRKFVNYGLIIYTAYYIFHITKGRFDTNISVRAGNKNWGTNIEQYPIFTAAIFMINKFLVFIVNIFLLIFLTTGKSEFLISKQSFFDRIETIFESVFVKMSESWYVMTAFIYLETFKSIDNQRAGMMMYSTGIVLISLAYVFSLISGIVGIFHGRKSNTYSAVAGEMITRSKSTANLSK